MAASPAVVPAMREYIPPHATKQSTHPADVPTWNVTFSSLTTVETQLTGKAKQLEEEHAKGMTEAERLRDVSFIVSRSSQLESDFLISLVRPFPGGQSIPSFASE
jgi:hypothetical protein